MHTTHAHPRLHATTPTHAHATHAHATTHAHTTHAHATTHAPASHASATMPHPTAAEHTCETNQTPVVNHVETV
jgi:hypothetical protein